tara:strand:- start:675 stop:947 length:273 start_codon:yes stop_codon:yes gene_type:complete
MEEIKFDVIEKNIPIPQRRGVVKTTNRYIYDFVDHAQVGDSMAFEDKKKCGVLRNAISNRKKSGKLDDKKFVERMLLNDGKTYWRYWRVK